MKLLRELDSTGRQWVNHWVDKRRAERRRLRTDCTIRFLSSDGREVLSVPGRTRDLSTTGIGVLAQQALARTAEVQVTLALPEGRRADLTGSVVYARPVRLGWYLVGIRLGPVRDRRLEPKTRIGVPYRAEDQVASTSESAEQVAASEA